MIFLDMFLVFLKIGLFTVGGGYAMLPLISDAVVAKGWLTTEQVMDFVAIAESTPGPFSINIATFVGNIVGQAALGSYLGSVLGVICAVGGLFLPSFIVILIVYKLAEKFMKNKIVADAFTAIRPTIVALIAAAFVSIAAATFVLAGSGGINSVNWFGIVWFALCFAAMRIFGKKLHPILVIIISAGVGILYYGVIMGGI